MQSTLRASFTLIRVCSLWRSAGAIGGPLWTCWLCRTPNRSRLTPWRKISQACAAAGTGAGHETEARNFLELSCYLGSREGWPQTAAAHVGVHVAGPTWDAISLGCSLSVLKGLVHAVQARHGHFGLPKPVHGDGKYQRLIKSLSRFNGTQHRHVFPIHRDQVVKLLQYEPLEHGGGSCEGPGRGCRYCWRSLIQWRNARCGVAHTIGCMRPDEGHNGQLCDWWPDYDSQAGHVEFAGGAALNISQQKNDAGRKGAHKRFGKSKDPALNF